jgi:hypothetical protein
MGASPYGCPAMSRYRVPGEASVTVQVLTAAEKDELCWLRPAPVRTKRTAEQGQEEQEEPRRR